MFYTKIIFTAILAMSCLTITSGAATFEWIRADIDVYELKVVSVKRGQLRAHISGVGTRTFSVPSDFRFQIDGVPTPLSGLVTNQKLKAYVKRTAKGTMQLVDAGPVKTIVPPAPAKTPVIAEVIETQDMMTLPKTGSVFPLTLGLALGSGMLALALRRRRMGS